MANINLKAVLGIYPQGKPNKTLITRGASADISYNLFDKWFRYESLAQLTFIFKQKNTYLWYNMFDYLAPTADIEVVEDKVYYTNLEVIEGKLCSAEVVKNPVGSPAMYGYYECIEPTDDQNDLYYMIDSHFSHVFGEGYDYISFVFTGNETAGFRPSIDAGEVAFEIAVKINTDSYVDLNKHDAVAIYPQASLIVADSLYSRMSGGETFSDDSLTVSDNLVVRG